LFLRISFKKPSPFIEEFIGFSFKKHPCNKKKDKAVKMSLFILLKVKKTPRLRG
jgi:hypothetical protein